MYRNAFICIVLNIIFCSTVLAADRIAVIPLFRTTTSSNHFFPVYDETNVFVGFHFSGGEDQTTLWSPQRFVASFPLFTGSFKGSTVYYSSSSCIGIEYYVYEYSSNFFEEAGYVFRTNYSPFDTVYIPKNAVPVQLNPAWSGPPVGGACYNQGSQLVYQTLPNDPSITGFQNSYNGSLRAIYTIPEAP